MVLATKVGKARPFWRGLVLTIVTVGVYWIYWNYKAPSEVYRQFELSREGRDEGVVWYVLGLVLFPLQFVYYWIMTSNVAYARHRMGLPRRTSPAAFVALLAIGLGAYAVGAVLLWSTTSVLPEDASPAQVETAMDAGVSAFAIGVLVALVLVPAAYRRLQRDINELWHAYDARMGELAREASAAPTA